MLFPKQALYVMKTAKMDEIPQARFPAHHIRDDAVDDERRTEDYSFFTINELGGRRRLPG